MSLHSLSPLQFTNVIARLHFVILALNGHKVVDIEVSYAHNNVLGFKNVLLKYRWCSLILESKLGTYVYVKKRRSQNTFLILIVFGKNCKTVF